MSSSPTPSDTAPSTSSDSSDTASLYLFTFLATILILVLLSASLVLRSYVLRRRYRQRLTHVLADGLFPDLDRSVFPTQGRLDRLRRSARPLPPSPVLWDTWILPTIKLDALSSITPLAARCTPSQLPSSSASSPQQLPASSSPSQSRPSIFSQLRIPSLFSHPRPSPSPQSSEPHTPSRLPTPTSTRSPPLAVPASSDLSDKDAGTLTICVLIAMPTLSSQPIHYPVLNSKGKGVEALDYKAHLGSGDVDPLLSSSLHRSDVRIPNTTLDDVGLPLLEFGILETGDWSRRIS